MKHFIAYDGRAAGGDTDKASVLDTANTEGEIRWLNTTSLKDMDAWWFEYDINEGDELTNEKQRIDLTVIPKNG